MTKPVLVIAEAGVNHNGSLETAKKLVLAAKEANADVVKFQTFKAVNLATKTAQKAAYQAKNEPGAENQFEMLKRLELSEKDFGELVLYAKSLGIRVFSTGFDLESLQFLAGFDFGIWKVPSGEITNLPYLEFIGRQAGQIILSTGMSNLEEIRAAVGVLEEAGMSRDRLTILHCNTEYPTPFEDVRLNAMLTIAREFKVDVGYSDHTQGLEVAVAAVALGARVIEKHFTLDREMPGPDHKASLEPHELKAMILAIRNTEKALGSAVKEPTPSEARNVSIARKSIVARRPITKGETFSDQNLTAKRPGTGLSPMKWYKVIGQTASRDFGEDEMITIENLK